MKTSNYTNTPLAVLKEFVLAASCVFYVGCGAQDYSEDPAVLEKKDEGTAAALKPTWRDLALGAIDRSAEISVGSLSSQSLLGALGGLSTSETCPTDTVCIRAPYVGERQFGHLSVSNSELVTITATSDQQTYAISNAPKLLIEADIFSLTAGFVLRAPGRDVTIVASEVSGDGTLDASPIDCSLPSKNGGRIRVVSGKVSNLQFRSNGCDGANGKDGRVDWLPARSGTSDLKQFSISADYKLRGVDVCVDISACLAELSAGLPLEEQVRLAWSREGFRKTQALINQHLQELEGLGFNRSEVAEATKRAHPSISAEGFDMKFGPGTGPCWFTSQPSRVGVETGVPADIRAVVTGEALLSGEDANHRSDGGDGESGGNAGEIEVTSVIVKMPRAEARAGRGGAAGKSFLQEPGRGATLATKLAFDYSLKGRVICKDSEGSKMNLPLLGDIDMSVYFQAPISGKVNKALEVNLSGRDGKSLEPKTTKDGVSGVEIEPRIIKAPVPEMAIQRVAVVCPQCKVPKAFGSN